MATRPTDTVPTRNELVETLKDRARVEVETARERLLAYSHRLHQNPEIGYEEVRAAQWTAEQLERVPGARITHGLGNLPTAVRAEIGSGELTFTICAEYDALPEIGHGCGHNIIAASALGAFVGLAPIVDQLGVTVRLLGTPAEESDGGKIDLLRQGFFDGTHAAMMVHPTSDDDEIAMHPLACVGYTARFIGRGAHASAAPWEGVNALDAMTIALTALGLARQQLESGQQVHGVVTSAGTAANIIPDSATGEWMIRALDMGSLKRLSTVFRRCFSAGAMATGAKLELNRSGNAFSELRTDKGMARYFFENAVLLGRDMKPERGLHAGSTDMGNVSQFFPTIHPVLTLGEGTPPMHTAEFAAFAATPAADRVVIDAALAMAFTVIDLASDGEERARLLALPRPSTVDAGMELDD